MSGTKARRHEGPKGVTAQWAFGEHSVSSFLRPCVPLLAVALITVSLVGCRAELDEQPDPMPDAPAAFEPDDDAIRMNNRGVGLMGQFEFHEAWTIFADLVEQHPDWIEARINLGIAMLNRQEDDYVGDARDIFADVLEVDPDNLRARYCIGLLTLYDGRAEEAIEHFRFVAEQDRRDAFAAYYTGQCLVQQRRHEDALEWFGKAIERNPYLASAYFAKSTAHRRLGEHDRADELFNQFQRLDDNPRARLVEFVYTRMGPKSEAKAVGRTVPAEPLPLPEGPLFADVNTLIDDASAIAWNAGWDDRRLGITVSDITGNGAMDIFIASALRHDGAYNAVLINDGDNRFSLDLDHPLARVDRVNAIAWGDIDNNGLTDAYLVRNGPNQLWKQTEHGEWENITDASGTANESYNSVDGLMIDADHDGDLDIFVVNADGPNELLNNNLDGTFSPIAQDQNIDGAGSPSRQVIAADVEGDRDLDLMVIGDGSPSEIYINELLWEYRKGGEEFGALLTMPITAAVAADLNAYGSADLITLNDEGIVHLWSQRAASSRRGAAKQWQSQRLFDFKSIFDEPAPPAHRAQMAVIDVTGDGALDLIISTSDGWVVLAIDDDGATLLHNETVDDLVGWTIATLHPSRGPSIVGVRAGETTEPLVWMPGEGRHEFAALSFSGKDDPGQQMRSNAAGIGTYFAARVGDRWTAALAVRHDAGPGQNLQPVPIGLGGADAIDFIHIDWSDGVFQSEIDLVAGQHHHVTATQRKLASCPVLFVWTGERYEFVSDVLGVAGIGFAVGPGEYAPSRPWENFMFPKGMMQPKPSRDREGAVYVVKLGEPMEEACYLDTARLVIYDVPQGWSMTLDERFDAAGPAPTGEPRFYRNSLLPAQAVNDRGEDVTYIVREQNHVAAPVGEHDRRFLGRLKRDHVLTLTFDKPLDAHDGEPMLIADGWIEYPYSQTAFAAWQAGADYRPPTLEAMGEDGEWRVVMEQFGYPAGMPRQMSVPLRDLPEGTTKLRLTTNQEIYWDRLKVAFAEPCPEAERRELKMTRAELKRTGFAEYTQKSQRRPHYDYDRRPPLWDTRHLPGYYTRFGPVEELVREANDALAIFGPGEEIHMEFIAPDDEPQEGWSRYHVIELEGWCKDMDRFTKHGDTLGPLPSSGTNPDIREQLHRKFNTRYRSGR